MFKYADYAYEIYKEKSFTKAADNLFISQPSLSLTIKKLESELGTTIFDRSGREITLTSIGEKYIAAIEQLKGIEKNLKNEIDDIQKLKTGSIVIGSTIFISSYVLPDILKIFKNLFPGIEVNIVVEQSTVLEEMLKNDTVDFIIDNTLQKQMQYEYIPILNEKILIGIPDDFSINDSIKKYEISHDDVKNDFKYYQTASGIDVSVLKNENFILLKKGNNMRKITNNIFKQCGITPTIAYEFDHLMTSISYAEANFGICFLTDTVLKYAKNLNGISLYLPCGKHQERSLYIIRKANKYHSFASNEMIKCITDFLIAKA